MVIKVYFINISKHVKRLFYIHTGFKDYYLYNSVGGVVYDIFFKRLRYEEGSKKG